MRPFQNNGLVYYGFDLFAPFEELVHGVFTRHGGVSPPPCEGLNLAFLDADREDNVRTNLDLAAEALDLDGLCFAGQVHGDRVLVVGNGDGCRPRSRAEVRRGYDALITRRPGMGLLVKLADCQGVLLYDPRTRTLGLVHSGWRGSVKNILGLTVSRMVEAFGVRPEDLRAGISPSLGPCCAEFVHYQNELPRDFWDYEVGDRRFDFWAISRDQLRAAGLKTEHIETAGLCTKCNGLTFYSYRRDPVTGRFGLIAGLRR
ncbi:MAG: polyphenol oxidase family protein [Proteobacteria bacterium]|nr:polyphenol oxidase family protein [Pseudomonadota bacterium]